MLNLDIEKPPQLSDIVYRQLYRAIVSGKISPGTVLVQEQVAQQLGISRTPVRDALDRLVRDGLITRSPAGRLHVAELSLDELRDKYEIRQVLEGLAAGLAAERIRPEELSALDAILERMRASVKAKDHHAVASAGGEFHDLIIEIAGNKELKQLLKELNDQLRRYRSVAVDIPGRIEDSLKEHEEVFQALAAHDRERSQASMQAHISGSKHQIEVAVRRYQEEGKASGAAGQ